MGIFGSFDVTGAKNKTEEESSTTSTGTKTGSQINSGSIDVGATMNSGRTDTSESINYNTGRTDIQNTDQTTTTSGGKVVNITDARQNTSSTSSSTFNSGRTDTSQTILTTEAVDRLIQQMMEGSQGLQAVSQGQRQSGGYNTTASTLLTNDLLARVGGEVAVRGAQTVNTIGASSSSTSSSTTENLGAINSTQTSLGGTSRVQGTSINTVGDSANISKAINVMGESSSESIMVKGGSRTDIYEEEKKQVDTKATKNETKVEVKTKISIICTYLHTQGRMESSIYFMSARSFREYPEYVRQGYYYWAIPVLASMKANPTAVKTKFYTWLLNSRCRGVTGIKTRWYDKLVATVTYGICAALGKTVARKHASSVILKGN